MLNKPIAEILTPPLAAAASHKDHLREKSLSTEGFTTTKFCEPILRDRSMSLHHSNEEKLAQNSIT